MQEHLAIKHPETQSLYARRVLQWQMLVPVPGFSASPLVLRLRCMPVGMHSSKGWSVESKRRQPAVRGMHPHF